MFFLLVVMRHSSYIKIIVKIGKHSTQKSSNSCVKQEYTGAGLEKTGSTGSVGFRLFRPK